MPIHHAERHLFLGFFQLLLLRFYLGVEAAVVVALGDEPAAHLPGFGLGALHALLHAVTLEAQVAEAAKNAEMAEQLRSQIAELKAQGESDRIDFKLQLAGVRNVKAARALLTDHDNDVDKLKEAEPWLFEATGKHAKGGNTGSGGTGTTGLPNAGAASDEGKTLKHWREIAGLTDDDKKE